MQHWGLCLNGAPLLKQNEGPHADPGFDSQAPALGVPSFLLGRPKKSEVSWETSHPSLVEQVGLGSYHLGLWASGCCGRELWAPEYPESVICFCQRILCSPLSLAAEMVFSQMLVLAYLMFMREMKRWGICKVLLCQSVYH